MKETLQEKAECEYKQECQVLVHRQGLCPENYKECDFYQVYLEVDTSQGHEVLNGVRR